MNLLHPFFANHYYQEYLVDAMTKGNVDCDADAACMSALRNGEVSLILIIFI